MAKPTIYDWQEEGLQHIVGLYLVIFQLDVWGNVRPIFKYGVERAPLSKQVAGRVAVGPGKIGL